MEKKEVNIGSPVTIAGVTLIPVSRVTINCWGGKRGLSFSGSRQPVSIIVITPETKRAFRITGEEIPFDQLAREIPDIKKSLEEIELRSY
jgi:uncharacterized spore protein YtfJ